MTRKINNTFYVSVEGECELMYLERLQELINSGDFSSSLRFIKKKDNPVSFAKSTATGYNEYPYYHICDYEGNKREDVIKFTHMLDDIKDARLITKVGYKLSYTNLCFELWIILHKKCLNKSFVNKSDYKDEINKVFNTDFNSMEELKKEQNFKKILKEISIKDIQYAIKNAKNIQSINEETQTISEYKGTEYYKNNPSLNLHEFVELVLKKCGVV